MIFMENRKNCIYKVIYLHIYLAYYLSYVFVNYIYRKFKKGVKWGSKKFRGRQLHVKADSNEASYPDCSGLLKGSNIQNYDCHASFNGKKQGEMGLLF